MITQDRTGCQVARFQSRAVRSQPAETAHVAIRRDVEADDLAAGNVMALELVDQCTAFEVPDTNDTVVAGREASLAIGAKATALTAPLWSTRRRKRRLLVATYSTSIAE